MHWSDSGTVSCASRAYCEISERSEFLFNRGCSLQSPTAIALVSNCQPTHSIKKSQFPEEEKRELIMMDLGYVSKAWDKWASTSVGSSGRPLKAALLINYELGGPSRLLPIIAEQEGLKVTPLDLNEFVEFVKKKQFQTETFVIAEGEYLVTSIYESWFCARSLNSTKPAGEGAIVMQTAVFLLIGLYEGSVDTASRAMSAVDQFAWQIGRKNL